MLPYQNKSYERKRKIDTYLLGSRENKKGDVHVLDSKFYLIDKIIVDDVILNEVVRVVEGDEYMYLKIISIWKKINNGVWLVDAEKVDRKDYRDILIERLIE